MNPVTCKIKNARIGWFPAIHSVFNIQNSINVLATLGSNGKNYMTNAMIGENIWKEVNAHQWQKHKQPGIDGNFINRI